MEQVSEMPASTTTSDASWQVEEHQENNSRNRNNRCSDSSASWQDAAECSVDRRRRGRRKEAGKNEEDEARRRRRSKHLKQANWWLLSAATVVLASCCALIAPLDAAATQECSRNEHCPSRDKICHENRCICNRDKPIEDKEGRCLGLALMGDPCSINEQCLSASQCIAGSCSCGPDSISFLNPSTNIYYCHAKRQLNEECNLDPQCPQNAYCSTKNSGCLCLNGYMQALVRDQASGKELAQCLAKTCADSSTCESEFHECVDNKCLCLATHFDPHTAKCYRFGSTGGQRLDGEPADSPPGSPGANLTGPVAAGGRVELSFQTLMEDLFKRGDKMWLVVVALLVLSLLMILLVFMALRRHYLGYCWTGGHKKEYEPNTKTPNANHFSKNSINNKSFRKKPEPDAADDAANEFHGPPDDVDEHTSIIDQSGKAQSKNGHMKGAATFNGISKHHQKKDNKTSASTLDDHSAAYQQQRTLLPSSTSTPV